ncbi:hypothetical protein TgHK011_000572 [Trichoderma gracile]|nr:hypothetical protein TgHK011_000572 [Trichoderma gracile]
MSRWPGSVHLCEAHTRPRMRRRLPLRPVMMAVSWLFRGWMRAIVGFLCPGAVSSLLPGEVRYYLFCTSIKSHP